MVHYRVGQKWHHLCTLYNFAKYLPISKFFSLLQSEENLQ